MMFLAVNLILLSFFIMLNALATRSEEKSKQAVLSMQKAVDVTPLTGIEAEADINRRLRLWQAERQEQFDALVQGKIQSSELIVQTDHASVEATLPLGIFFTDQAAELKPDGQAFLENFAAAMVGQGYVRVLVRMPETSVLLAAKRAGAVRTTLDAAVPEGSPAAEVGFSEGEPRLLVLMTPPVEIRQAKPSGKKEGR